MDYKSYFKSNDFLSRLVIFLLVLLVYHSVYGLETILPTNINWLLSVRHDWGQHYLGWAFYRDEPWAFPLGNMDAVRYPIGSNVGFWDNVPGMSILLKPLSPLLPEDFQYLGFWLLLCMLLSAHYTVKIFSLYRVKPVYAVIGALLVACNPVLIYRGMHPALSSHFLIIASLYYYLQPAYQHNEAKINRKQILLFAVSAAINPYLCFMVSGFNVILPLKHYLYDKVISVKKVLLYITLSLASVFVVYFLIGMIVLGSNDMLEVGGAYQLYGMNLNALINAGGYSRYFPQLPWVSPHQYEGFMYMGIGIMLIIAVTLIYSIISKRFSGFVKFHKFLLPLFVLLVASTLFAISNRVTYNDHILFEYPIPHILQKLGDTFRACGRVIWVSFYAGIIFILLLFSKSRLNSRVKTGILALAVFIQAYDLKLMYFRPQQLYGEYDSPLDEARWKQVVSGFDRMITYPPFNNHLLHPMDYQDLSFIALKNHKPISIGYTARDTPLKNQMVADSLTNALLNGFISSKEVYITTPEYIEAFRSLLHNKKADVVYLDGYYVLFDAGAKVNVKQDGIAAQKRDSLIQSFTNTAYTEIANAGITAGTIKYHTESITTAKNSVALTGWAYREDTGNNKGDSVFIAVKSGGKVYLADTKQFKRPDLTEAYKKDYLEDSGFRSIVFTENFKLSDSLGIIIKTPQGKKYYTGLGSFEQLGKTEGLTEVTALPGLNNQIGYIDGLETAYGKIKINGWTAIRGQNAFGNKISVIFMGAKKNFAVTAKITQRQDVTASRKDGFNYDDSGFDVLVSESDVPAGGYKLALLITDSNGQESMLVSDKKVTIKH